MSDSHATSPTFADVTRDVARTLAPPGNLYFGWMSVVALILTAGIVAWTGQIWWGMGMAGKRVPQMWAMYITSFVFWIGIGHAGTLISAILYLFRARWRTSIYRAAEAMTIFAVMTAGLFPLIHAGRMWFAYYLLPYPNQRSLWPNFRSPLVWDVFAISTYLSISTVFFVDGAIFSGFAMVLILVLPMRHFFRLHAYIQEKHLDAMGKLILVTGLVLTYFYLCEIFTSLYSGDDIEKASLFWKVTKTYAWALWLMYFCNCVSPLVLFWKKARTSPVVLYVVSILVLIGMWFERFNIIVPSLGHDFYPYTWGIYYPSPTDTMIVIGSFSFFFLLFLGFIKVMPSLSIVEVKETIPPPVRDRAHGH